MSGSIGKEMFLRAHEALISEYMEAHPNADESKVYDQMADKAMDRVREDMADLIDAAKDEAKYKDVK